MAKILDDDLRADPLSIEAWTLIIGLEILFGGSEAREGGSDRSVELAAAVAKRELGICANAFNDAELLGNTNDSARVLLAADQATLGKFRGCSFHRVPNAVLMMDCLVTLDLSNNFLVEIPASIGRLAKLEVLNVSQNALLELPASVSKLSELRVLDVSHNNLSSTPGSLWVHLLKLQELDLSANLIAHLPAPPLARLQELRVLQIGNNLLSAENVAQLRTLLGSKCAGADGSNRSAAATETSHHTVELVEEAEPTARVAKSGGRGESGVVARGSEADASKDVARTPSGSSESDSSAEEASLVSSETPVDAVAEASRPNSTEASCENEVVTEDTSVIEADASATLEATGTSASVPISLEGDTAQATAAVTASLADAMAITAGEANGEQAPRVLSPTEFYDKFVKFMSENNLSRADVKQRHPALWKRFIHSQLYLHSNLSRCVMCALPNAGLNQRFNTMVMCPSCMGVAVELLQMRAPPTREQASGASAESKQDN